jgi:hypothetical protein
MTRPLPAPNHFFLAPLPSFCPSTRALAAAFALAGGLALGAPAARACEPPAAPERFAVDEAPPRVDPAPPAPRAWLLTYREPQAGEGATCPVDGSIVLAVAPPADDRAAADELGYRLEVVGGGAPEGLLVPSWPVRAERTADGPVIELTWQSLGGAAESAPSFQVAVYAVDRAGNESQTPASVYVTADRGDGPTECCYGSVAGAAAGVRPGTSAAGFVALGLAGLARVVASRRRRAEGAARSRGRT